MPTLQKSCEFSHDSFFVYDILSLNSIDGI